MLNRKDQTKSINFLQSEGSTEGVIQTSFAWLTTIGKWILVVVQVIVLAAFGYRLLKDGRNNDLTADINDQVKTLENETWKKNVIKYQNLQSLLGDIKIVKDGQELNSNLISEILNGIPLTINVENLSVNNSRVNLALTTTDFKALRDYEDSLKTNASYSDVKVNITLKGQEYEVTITFNVVKGEE